MLVAWTGSLVVVELEECDEEAQAVAGLLECPLDAAASEVSPAAGTSMNRK